MANKQESERIAASINILRPDWSTGLILAVLGDNRCIRRGYADLAIAMTCVAVDPVSKKPGRIHESGPWWNASLATSPRPQVLAFHPELTCVTCFKRRDDCRLADARAPLDCQHEFSSSVDEAKRPKVKLSKIQLSQTPTEGIA